MSKIQRYGLFISIAGNAMLWGTAFDAGMQGAYHAIGLVAFIIGGSMFIHDSEDNA